MVKLLELTRCAEVPAEASILSDRFVPSGSVVSAVSATMVTFDFVQLALSKALPLRTNSVSFPH